MTVAMRQGSVITEIGPGSILHAFFSSVCSNLESGNWGSRFPTLMHDLYSGKLDQSKTKTAILEIQVVITELKSIPANKLVWDIDKPNAEPPPEYDCMCNKESLYSYFRTSTGRNLPFEIKENLESQAEFGGDLEIISYKNIVETIR